MQPRPSELRINGRTVPVLYKRLPDSHGVFDLIKGTITIKSNQGWNDERDALLHEAGHAILHYAGIETCEAEEKYVRALASGFLGFLLDNPTVTTWLLETTSPETRSKPAPKRTPTRPAGSESSEKAPAAP